jgi:hypothetical protein
VVITAAGVVAHPGIVVVDVGSFGMIRAVPESLTIVGSAAFLWSCFLGTVFRAVIFSRRRATCRWRAMLGHVTPADVASLAGLVLSLGPTGAGGHNRSQGEQQECR